MAQNTATMGVLRREKNVSVCLTRLAHTLHESMAGRELLAGTPMVGGLLIIPRRQGRYVGIEPTCTTSATWIRTPPRYGSPFRLQSPLLGRSMKQIQTVLALVFVNLIVSSGEAEEYRLWKTNRGHTTRVKLSAVEVVDGSVRFKREDDGREFTFSIQRLSDEDQRALEEQFDFDASDPALTHGNNSNALPRVRWDAPMLTDENVDEWSEYLWPTEKDLAWRRIRWHNNLGDAIDEARRLQRPILLWTKS